MSSKGGVAKSSLCTGFAWELMVSGARVLLVDADPRIGSQLEAGERAAESGRLAPTIISMGADMYRPEQMPRLAKDYDHVIIDTPGADDNVQRSAMLVSDVAVIPICPSRYDFRGLARTLGVLGEAQTVRPLLRGVVVLTRLTKRTNVAEEASAALIQAGVPLLKARTWHRMAWPEATEEGLGVGQYAPESKAAQELRQVMAEVFKVGATRRKKR